MSHARKRLYTVYSQSDVLFGGVHCSQLSVKYSDETDKSNRWMNILSLTHMAYLNADSTLHNISLKLSHAICLQLELYCANQAHNLPTLSFIYTVQLK